MFNYVEKLQNIDDFKKLKEENEKIVFLFSASWCPDCIVVDQFLESVMNDFSDIKFIYVDRDNFPEITQALDVFGIPSFIGYKNEKEVARFVSKNRKTRAEIEDFLKNI